jgi:hypothetical protein
MPVQPLPFEAIINVAWQGGLAVIFGPQDQDAPKQEQPDELFGNARSVATQHE